MALFALGAVLGKHEASMVRSQASEADLLALTRIVLERDGPGGDEA
jgi:hypothetical protein